MPNAYPYTISNNKIEPFLAKVRSAAKPERISQQLISKWGFTASNDRAMLRVLKDLGFLDEGGVPTEHYDRLRDPNDWKYALGDQMRELYSELFAIDTKIENAPDTEVKGAIARITGKDEDSVKRYLATFKTLTGLANFAPKPGKAAAPPAPLKDKPKDEAKQLERAAQKPDALRREDVGLSGPDFHYNIQLILPITTDITVYNAIFRSLKENLSI
jgi:hypothetical protein